MATCRAARYTATPAADPTVPGANGKKPMYPELQTKTARRRMRVDLSGRGANHARVREAIVQRESICAYDAGKKSRAKRQSRYEIRQCADGGTSNRYAVLFLRDDLDTKGHLADRLPAHSGERDEVAAVQQQKE